MTDWTAGYVADIGYTYGYYGELNPARIKLAFLDAGLVPPATGHACELGFGQGLSTAIHAAASATRWHGTDFNPAHAAFAQELATLSGSGAELVDQSFGEFCARADLPQFDFIGLHGIWSWVSDENRHILVDFLRRKLKVGGVVYVSYNTEPGWASMVPLRRLMTRHGAVMSAPGISTVDKVGNALAFTERLLATDPLFAKVNPMVAERMKLIKGQPRAYLAHEYFNDDWHPMAFLAMADWLQPAKLDYACSTHLLDHVDAINLSPEQQTLLGEIADPALRESVRDFMVNQSFRRDYWVRGARRLSPADSMAAQRQLRVMLVTPRANIGLRVKGARGEADMHVPLYTPVLDALADYQVRSIGELETQLAGQGVAIGQLLQVVLILAGKGDLALVQDAAAVEQVRARCALLNRHLIDKARGSGDITFLASPVTGGGIPVPRFHQLFLLARLQGGATAAQLGAFALAVVEAQGHKLLKEGKPVHERGAALDEISQQAAVFLEQHLPVLRALGIAD